MKVNLTRLNCTLGHRRERVALSVPLDCGRRAWCLFPDGPTALTFRDTDPLLERGKQEWGSVVMSEQELAGFLRQQSGDLVACAPVPQARSVDCIEAAALLEMLGHGRAVAELQSYTRADLPDSRPADDQ